MLGKRIISGLIGGVITIGVIYEGNWLFFIFMMLLAVLAWKEYAQLMDKVSVQVPLRVGMVWLLCFLGTIWCGAWQAVLLMGAILLYGLLLQPVFRHQYSTLRDVAYALLGLVYVGIGFAALLVLRCGNLGLQLSDQFSSQFIDPSRILVFLLIFATWASDTFAFFVGKFWGRHKLCPDISPGKTREGMVGGIVGTIVVALAVAVGGQFSLLHGGVLGILIAFTAPAGDLIESIMKRTCRTKDSGSLIPGHGGVLDRFDSLLLAAPVVCVYLYFIAR